MREGYGFCTTGLLRPGAPRINIPAPTPPARLLLPGGLAQIQKANINQYGFYFGDTIKAGNFTIDGGLREDQYNGLASANGVQPRLAVSYLVSKTNTVLRAGYARTFETPFNENLILSSGTGPGGLAQNVFGSNSVPIEPGFRNQFNTGLQQGIGHWLR